MKGRVEQVSSREVYRNAWISVREDEVRHADGSPGIYGVVDKPDFALVVPRQDDGLWLVEQYRYPVGRRAWEFPQGTWGHGQTGSGLALAAAELREETGLVAGSTVHLGRLSLAYGLTGQGYDVYLATDLVAGPPAREASEQDMVSRWFPTADVVAMVRSGEVEDASTVAAYALLLLHDGVAPA